MYGVLLDRQRVLPLLVDLVAPRPCGRMGRCAMLAVGGRGDHD